MSMSMNTTHRSSPISSSTGESSTQHLAEIVVTAAQSNQKSSNIVQLRLSHMKLHGRDNDIKLLRGKLRELAKKKDVNAAAAEENNKHEGNNSNLILVSGTCGTGKSALIQKGLGKDASKIGCTFTSGKFDAKLRSPLSAFSDAMTNLTRYITVEHEKKGKKSPSGGGLPIATLIREQIQNEFDDDDVEQLRRVLPGCAELLGARRSSLFGPSSEAEAAVLHRSASVSKLDSLKRHSGKESISRVHYAIRRLLKVICSYLKGVVLFIDDLQWSDIATLELLKSIVLDRDIPSLLIVGAYREDEVPDHHPLAYHIRDMEQMNVSINQIKVGNLGVDNVISLVAEALGMDDNDNKVKSLAETIHKKTQGNPFFVLTFLRSLYDEQLLQYNFGAMKWTWDDDAVNSKIVTDNVASVLVKKMNRLKEETQSMLMVASCLGATFRLSAVMEVMKNISRAEMRSSIRFAPGTKATTGSSSTSLLTTIDNSISSSDRDSSAYASSVKEFEEEGLCEVGNEECRFVHDQIQSAAFELICPDQRDSFRGRIGSILLQSLSPQELEACLFEVVGLMNCAASNITEDERDELAKMNLKAGIKASQHAAFDTAKVYFEAGREVGSRGWEGDYSTILDICSDWANACYVTGDFEKMDELIDEVLSRDIDTKEKYRVSDIKVNSLLIRGKVNESIDAALDFRRQLGLPTVKKKPASKFAIMRECIRVVMLLKNKSAEDIANLPELDDERLEMGQRMNTHLSTCVYQVEPTMLPLIIFQGATTALKHGLSPSSSPTFAGLGMLFCGPLCKPQHAHKMAKAAELILAKSGTRSSVAHTIFLTHTYCHHWISPIQDSIAPLLEGYQVGLEIGDTDRACFCLVVRSYRLYFMGQPLASIQNELEATVQVMTQLKQDSARLRILILLTTVKRLRGGLDAEAGADDKIMDSMLATAADTHNTLSAFVNLMKLEVLVLFQEWEEAIDVVQKAGNVRLLLPSSFNSVRYTFLEALTYLKTAQSSASGSKKRQMEKCGQKTIQIIRGWVKNGNVNVVHYLQILDAELAVLHGKNKKAKESFNAAIAASRKIGFLQDRALAHELASLYFKAQGDEYWRNYHIECSRACYQEWGCSDKAE